MTGFNQALIDFRQTYGKALEHEPPPRPPSPRLYSLVSDAIAPFAVPNSQEAARLRLTAVRTFSVLGNSVLWVRELRQGTSGAGEG